MWGACGEQIHPRAVVPVFSTADPPPLLSRQRVAHGLSYVDKFVSGIRPNQTCSVAPNVSTPDMSPPAVSTEDNSLMVVHRYVPSGIGPGKYGRGTTPPSSSRARRFRAGPALPLLSLKRAARFLLLSYLDMVSLDILHRQSLHI